MRTPAESKARPTLPHSRRDAGGRGPARIRFPRWTPPPLPPVLLGLLLVSAVFFCGPGTIAAQTDEGRPRLLRISLENTETHVKTRAVLDFADALREAAGDRFTVEVHHTGSLFRGADVFAALDRGQVEMAVPGTWHVSRFEPDVAVFLLPEFFGREIEFQHHHADGALGREVTRRIEEELGVVVPGRWLDLGHGHLFFTTRRPPGHGDLAGLTIRVAGGRANEMRVEALGAAAVTFAWGEVPERLARGHMDGLLTTYETVRSGRLWDHGVRSVLEDYQYMPQYVPMISRTFWETLQEPDRELIRRLWDRQVGAQRAAAARAQNHARDALRDRGVRIETLDPQALARTRAMLLAHQSDFVRILGIDPLILEFLENHE